LIKIIYCIIISLDSGKITQLLQHLTVVDNIYEKLDANQTVVGIYLDLTKAFDTVNHDILLYKLQNYGIRGTAYQWFRSYLSNRQQ